MEPSYRQFMFASAILLTMAPSQKLLAADPMVSSMEDIRRESQIATSYALNPYLRANDLKVSVQKGKAILTGKVDEKISKELASEIALGVSGITAVDNQIVVEANYLPPYRKDGFGNKIDDASITAAIRSKLQWNKDVDSVGTDVSTQNGRVTLNGHADSQSAKEIANRLAMNTRGVISVTNNLKVRENLMSDAEKARVKINDKSNNISDSWITAKVKSSFMYSSNINGGEIDVSTHDGVVTLTGRVANGIERAMAIEMAQNIRGVKSVTFNSLVF